MPAKHELSSSFIVVVAPCLLHQAKVTECICHKLSLPYYCTRLKVSISALSTHHVQHATAVQYTIMISLVEDLCIA